MHMPCAKLCVCDCSICMMLYASLYPMQLSYRDRLQSELISSAWEAYRWNWAILSIQKTHAEPHQRWPSAWSLIEVIWHHVSRGLIHWACWLETIYWCYQSTQPRELSEHIMLELHDDMYAGQSGMTRNADSLLLDADCKRRKELKMADPSRQRDKTATRKETILLCCTQKVSGRKMCINSSTKIPMEGRYGKSCNALMQLQNASYDEMSQEQ